MNIFKFTSFLLDSCKNPEPINNKSDYCRIKRWKNKATFLYFLFTIVAVIIFLTVLSNISTYSAYIDLPEPLIYLAIPFVSIFAAWGFATMLLNFKLLIKSTWKVGVEGYNTGEQIQTNNVYLTHEYGNSYKVRTETENQGCAVAMINATINLFIWAFLCVYVCPFLMFGKISKTEKKLRRYKSVKK